AGRVSSPFGDGLEGPARGGRRAVQVGPRDAGERCDRRVAGADQREIGVGIRLDVVAGELELDVTFARVGRAGPDGAVRGQVRLAHAQKVADPAVRNIEVQ